MPRHEFSCFLVHFLEVLTSTLRMDPSILRGLSPTYLSLWRDLCNVILVSKRFLVLLGYSFLFSFHHCTFNGVHFENSHVFGGSHFFEHSNFDLIWLFYSFRHMLFSAFHYQHRTFFYTKLPMLYILTTCIRVSNSSSFLANSLMSSM